MVVVVIVPFGVDLVLLLLLFVVDPFIFLRLFLFSFLFYIHNEEVTAVIYQISAVVVPHIFFAIFALTSSVLLSFILSNIGVFDLFLNIFCSK